MGGFFFHGYCDGYRYLPLCVFCGRHPLGAKLRRANIVAAAGAAWEMAWIVGRVRARWPQVRIVPRADSGFAREARKLSEAAGAAPSCAAPGRLR